MNQSDPEQQMTAETQKEKTYRPLSTIEIRRLEERGSVCTDWQQVIVESPFDPEKVSGCIFRGDVRIGAMRESAVSDGDLSLPSGLYQSTLENCTIGADSALHRVGYCRDYSIGDRVLLSSVSELTASPRRKTPRTKLPFSLSVMNEAGGREIFPLPGMTTAMAWAWAKFRDRLDFVTAMENSALAWLNSRQGTFPAYIANGASLRNCGGLRDSCIGPGSRIKGVGSIQAVFIDSSEESPVIIGTGTCLENGVISPGCSVERGSTLLRFFLAENVSIDLNARIVDTWVGDNSHIACCEVRSSLLFPGHEQHHNNSFLIAAELQGMSNIAAGATIGSNHNSRAADNELSAARGFWPGLCTSLKHPSRFSSFCLIAKGDYPSELNIPLPFSLLNNNTAENTLEIMPAYWWIYNKYALFRNSYKVRSRDHRVHKRQTVTSSFLAPDTADEILRALELLSAAGESHRYERSRREVKVLKKSRAIEAYREMLSLYAAESISRWIQAEEPKSWNEVLQKLESEKISGWLNFGGEISSALRVQTFISRTASGELDSLEKQIGYLNGHAAEENSARASHGLAVFSYLLKKQGVETEKTSPSLKDWNSLLTSATGILTTIEKEVVQKRTEDFSDPFRTALYRCEAEKSAVLGDPRKNSFAEGIHKENNLLRRQFAAASLRS